MIVCYGTINQNINITQKVLDCLSLGSYFHIPKGDFRKVSILGGDPYPNVRKSIIIYIENQVFEFDDTKNIFGNFLTNEIYDENDEILNLFSYELKLINLQDKLIFNHGRIYDEYPEQLMLIKTLKGDEKVLEIGGNIGRTSLIIASLLNNDQNFVSMECNETYAIQLTDNRDVNNFKFFVENSALSKDPLVQDFWTTYKKDQFVGGVEIPIISYDELKNKYNIDFDTLFLDCEGSFYYILKDFPEILNGIQSIIIENDFTEINHKIEVDQILIENQFKITFSQKGGWGPCSDFFYQIWQK